MYTFLQAGSSNKDFKNLVAMLDKELAIRDGNEHFFYAQFNKIENIKNVIVAYDGQQATGTGAFKEYDPDVVEIKRML